MSATLALPRRRAGVRAKGWSRHWIAAALLAPAMLLVVGTTVWPLASSLLTSLQDWQLLYDPAPTGFVGAANYAYALVEDPAFWRAASVTLTYVVVDVVLCLLAALGMALLLLRAGMARTMLRTLIVLPFAMTPALIGLSWRFMLNSEFGVMQRAIGVVIPPLAGVDWFSDPALAMAAVISADVWHWAPYFAFVLMGGLAAIPPETQEAARTDGASPWRVFVDITLPQLAPTLAVCAVLKSVFALKSFDLFITMTGGGPGDSTTPVGYLAYRIGFQHYDMGYSAAVAYLLTAVLVLLSFLYMRLVFRR